MHGLVGSIRRFGFSGSRDPRDGIGGEEGGPNVYLSYFYYVNRAGAKIGSLVDIQNTTQFFKKKQDVQSK